MTSVEVERFAFDRDRILREDRRCVEEGAMVLAAIQAVADADPVRLTRCGNSNVAAQAPAGDAHCGFSTWPPNPKRMAESNLSAKLSSILLR